MTKLFAEQPILLSVLLGLLAAALLYAWTRSGQRGMGIAGGVLLLMIPVVWFVAGKIVTEEEQIQAMLAELAEHVEANRFEQAYLAIHPDQEEVLRRAQAELPRYEFSRARIASFRTVQLLDGTEPPQAFVDLNAGVTLSVKNGALQGQKISRRLLLHLEKTPSGWKVIDYDHRPLIGGRDGYSSGDKDLEKLLRR